MPVAAGLPQRGQPAQHLMQAVAQFLGTRAQRGIAVDVGHEIVVIERGRRLVGLLRGVEPDAALGAGAQFGQPLELLGVDPDRPRRDELVALVGEPDLHRRAQQPAQAGHADVEVVARAGRIGFGPVQRAQAAARDRSAAVQHQQAQQRGRLAVRQCGQRFVTDRQPEAVEQVHVHRVRGRVVRHGRREGVVDPLGGTVVEGHRAWTEGLDLRCVHAVFSPAGSVARPACRRGLGGSRLSKPCEAC